MIFQEKIETKLLGYEVEAVLKEKDDGCFYTAIHCFDNGKIVSDEAPNIWDAIVTLLSIVDLKYGVSLNSSNRVLSHLAKQSGDRHEECAKWVRERAVNVPAYYGNILFVYQLSGKLILKYGLKPEFPEYFKKINAFLGGE